MDDKELEKLKAEISYHTMCKPCRGCGECERVLDIALKEEKERRETKGMPRPCDDCRA